MDRNEFLGITITGLWGVGIMSRSLGGLLAASDEDV